MSSTPTVALLGTGTMGAGMARNIAGDGLPLRVWNRSRGRAQELADVAQVAESVADAVGGRTMWVGGAGAGSRLELAANAWVATVLEGVAESLAFARDLGLDPALFLEAIEGGAMDAPYVQLKGKSMLAGEFPPAFRLAEHSRTWTSSSPPQMTRALIWD